MIGTSEAMNLGQNLGLDPKLLAEVINKSTGRCWSSELYNPCPGVLENVPSSNNYQGGFGTALMTKVEILLSLIRQYSFIYICYNDHNIEKFSEQSRTLSTRNFF